MLVPGEIGVLRSPLCGVLHWSPEGAGRMVLGPSSKRDGNMTIKHRTMLIGPIGHIEGVQPPLKET